MSELQSVMEAGNRKFVPNKIHEFLNIPPTSPVVQDSPTQFHLVVISPGDWGLFSQRHILHITQGVYHHIHDMWGAPEAAATFKNEAKQWVSLLSFYPLLDMRWAEKEELESTKNAAYEFALKHLPLIPEAAIIRNDCLSPGFISKWYDPALPLGTTYNVCHRDLVPNFNDEMPAYYKLAPLNPFIAYNYSRRVSADSNDFNDVLKILSPLADYNYLFAIQIGLNMNEPEKYIPYYEKAARLNPDAYYDLAERLIKNHLEEKAAEYYQKGLDLDEDAVRASNKASWLVNYYYEHKQKDKALELATKAADVYSSGGLNTLLELKDKMGDLDGAEKLARAIMERYNSNNSLAAFYSRHPERPGAKEFLESAEKNLKKAFPDGVHRVSLSSFREKPSDGVYFIPNERLISLGFQIDTIIVALDGIQVGNLEQFQSVRALSISPKMTFIVWRHDHYNEISVEQAGRRFNVGMGEYHSP